MDRTKLIEQAQRLLHRREEALRATLGEISTLEAGQDPKSPSPAIAAAIAAARTKRDRQENARLASEGLIEALTNLAKKGK